MWSRSPAQCCSCWCSWYIAITRCCSSGVRTGPTFGPRTSWGNNLSFWWTWLLLFGIRLFLKGWRGTCWSRLGWCLIWKERVDQTDTFPSKGEVWSLGDHRCCVVSTACSTSSRHVLEATVGSLGDVRWRHWILGVGNSGRMRLLIYLCIYICFLHTWNDLINN